MELARGRLLMMGRRREQPETGKPPGAAASFSLFHPGPWEEVEQHYIPTPASLPQICSSPPLFIHPCPFSSCFIILLLYSGAAPICQILSIILPHSGTFSGNQAGEDGIRHFITLVLWCDVLPALAQPFIPWQNPSLS